MKRTIAPQLPKCSGNCVVYASFCDQKTLDQKKVLANSL
ncbi:hypothetical protein CEV33_2251 [Brucella grignonensis]|uniref:Uncharacterized protein n=1 Tax=Brucella grignonensis TaxID=94627 RepID=A0A256F7F5_9HYPH|nr:hypothetical protein CEV33_2251 [Brucella grignonensis]